MRTRIIVIDDDEATRQLIVHNLQVRGYEVLSYDLASIGLAALIELQPDLIVLDFKVRDSGLGWEFLQLLKMEDTTANIPILILTTTVNMSTEIQSYLWSRYIGVIHKPFDIDQFLLLVRQTLMQAAQAGTLFSSDHPLPILIVDDNESLRDALSTILTLEGYQVATADNGRLALDTVYKADYCLILLDIDMPIMNGFEFLKAYARQLRPHTPVIILSGAENLVDHVFPSFVMEVLPKPFEVGRLVQIAKKYVQPA